MTAMNPHIDANSPLNINSSLKDNQAQQTYRKPLKRNNAPFAPPPVSTFNLLSAAVNGEAIDIKTPTIESTDANIGSPESKKSKTEPRIPSKRISGRGYYRDETRVPSGLGRGLTRKPFGKVAVQFQEPPKAPPPSESRETSDLGKTKFEAKKSHESLTDWASPRVRKGVEVDGGSSNVNLPGLNPPSTSPNQNPLMATSKAPELPKDSFASGPVDTRSYHADFDERRHRNNGPPRDRSWDRRDNDQRGFDRFDRFDGNRQRRPDRDEMRGSWNQDYHNDRRNFDRNRYDMPRNDAQSYGGRNDPLSSNNFNSQNYGYGNNAPRFPAPPGQPPVPYSSHPQPASYPNAPHPPQFGYQAPGNPYAAQQPPAAPIAPGHPPVAPGYPPVAPGHPPVAPGHPSNPTPGYGQPPAHYPGQGPMQPPNVPTNYPQPPSNTFAPQPAANTIPPVAPQAAPGHSSWNTQYQPPAPGQSLPPASNAAFGFNPYQPSSSLPNNPQSNPYNQFPPTQQTSGYGGYPSPQNVPPAGVTSTTNVRDAAVPSAEVSGSAQPAQPAVIPPGVSAEEMKEYHKQWEDYKKRWDEYQKQLAEYKKQQELLSGQLAAAAAAASALPQFQQAPAPQPVPAPAASQMQPQYQPQPGVPTGYQAQAPSQPIPQQLIPQQGQYQPGQTPYQYAGPQAQPVPPPAGYQMPAYPAPTGVAPPGYPSAPH